MAERPLATLLPQVRRDGLARKIPSWIKVAHAPVARVDISAALLTEGVLFKGGSLMLPQVRTAMEHRQQSPAYDKNESWTQVLFEEHQSLEPEGPDGEGREEVGSYA